MPVHRLVILIALTCSFANPGSGQSPLPTPTPADQDRIKIFTEEVVFTIKVTDSQGRFDPSLHKDELLVLEDGQPQQVLSARQLPASVLLLIGAAGELNPAMKANYSKDVSAHLVSNLTGENQIAVLQYGRDVEILQPWTTERDQAEHAIRTKLSSSKGAHLANALAQSVEHFKQTKAGNRHLVLITDGVEGSPDGLEGLQSKVADLLTQGVTVHVLSYSHMGRSQMWKSKPLIRVTGKKPYKSASDIAAEIINPTAIRYDKPKIHLIIDTDIQMRLRRAEYLKAMKEGERWLTSFADETGGTMSAPNSIDNMLREAEAIARSINSQYVVTYKPKRPFASDIEREYRRIDVVPRRVGLNITTRRGYVANKAIH